MGFCVCLGQLAVKLTGKVTGHNVQVEDVLYNNHGTVQNNLHYTHLLHALMQVMQHIQTHADQTMSDSRIDYDIYLTR